MALPAAGTIPECLGPRELCSITLQAATRVSACLRAVFVSDKSHAHDTHVSWCPFLCCARSSNQRGLWREEAVLSEENICKVMLLLRFHCDSCHRQSQQSSSTQILQSHLLVRVTPLTPRRGQTNPAQLPWLTTQSPERHSPAKESNIMLEDQSSPSPGREGKYL